MNENNLVSLPKSYVFFLKGKNRVRDQALPELNKNKLFLRFLKKIETMSDANYFSILPTDVNLLLFTRYALGLDLIPLLLASKSWFNQIAPIFEILFPYSQVSFYSGR